MFSSKSQLQRRTPDNGTDREHFLSLLVDEYLNSVSYDAKCQVLANLANFAYDPVNYGYMRDVGVLDVFLYVIKNENDETLLHFASSGICNLCVDPLNGIYIHENEGLVPLSALLKSSNTEIVANIITIFIYLYNEQSKTELTNPETVQIIEDLKKSTNGTLANLATIFFEDIHNSNCAQ